jgi:hypothetical protein
LPILLCWNIKPIYMPKKQCKSLGRSEKVSWISLHRLSWKGYVWTKNNFQKKSNHLLSHGLSKNYSFCQIFSLEKRGNRSLKDNFAIIYRCFINVIMFVIMFYWKLMD